MEQGEVTKEQLEALQKRFTQHPSIAPAKRLEVGAWTAAGDPHCWILYEQAHGYTVLVDTGYGIFALFQGCELLATSKHHLIVHSGVVVLDREYYGADKAIWL